MPENRLSEWIRDSICAGPSTNRPFGKAVRDELAVIGAIRSAGEPSGHLVLARHRQRQHQDEFRIFGAWQLGHHVIRLQLDLPVAIEFARHLPSILPIVEGRGIGHVVRAVHFRLDGKQILGVADVALEVRGHLAALAKQTREHVLVRLDDRIVGSKDVERHRPVIGVDHGLDRIAQVIAAVETGSEP